MCKAQKVSVIVVGYKSDPSELCILFEKLNEQIREAGFNPESVYVSNDETDFRSVGADVEVYGHGNVGFARGNRLGLEKSSGVYCLFINPDTYPSENLISSLLEVAKERAGKNIFLPICRKENGEVDLLAYLNWTYTPSRFISYLVSRRYFQRLNGTSALPRWLKAPGAAIFMNRETAMELGPFDTYYFLYAEDRDMSRRARRQNITQIIVADTTVTHLSGQSSAKVPSLVLSSQIDGSVRVAQRRHGRIGAILAFIDLFTVDLVKRKGKISEQKKEIFKKWRFNRFKDHPTSLNSLLRNYTK